jgi:putative ABC transport system permease protein
MSLYTIRHALRLLARDRAFTATAVLTLALGIGANVAIFAVAEAVLLRPLPYRDADDLLVLRHRDERTGVTKEFIAVGDYIDLRAKQTVFESLASYGGGFGTITGHGDPYRASILQAGPGLLQVLRLEPAAGRLLDADDSRPGAAPVAMISHDLWEKLFAGDRNAIGRALNLGPVQRQVVGVAPKGFRFPAGASTDVIVPATLPPSPPANRKSGWVFALARLQPGVSLDDAASHLAVLSHGMEAEFPESNEGSLYYPVGLRDHLLGDTKQPLLLLLASVAVVLLIACANVGNLLLARALGRRQEMAVRVALGAGRARLAGQLLTESLALALTAGAAGLLLASWTLPALVALVPSQVAIPGLAEVGINGNVLAFTLGICVASALAFALLSAFTIRRESGASALVAYTRVAGSRAARRTTSAFIVLEVALSVVLLIGAGLILRTFAALLSVDPGFQIERVALVDIALPADRFQAAAARQGFYRRAFTELAELRGVVTVGAAAVVPLTGNNWTVPFERADHRAAAGARPPDVGWQTASGGYFQALRIPLLAGRLFDARDVPGSPPVVIISRTVEQRYFDGEPAVGRRIWNGDSEAEIVGVVGDIRRAGLAEAPRADMYFPFERGPAGATTLFVHTSADPRSVLPAVQTLLRTIEPGIVIAQTRTLSGIAGESVASTRLALWLLGLFAGVALVLAAVGVYGVMSYAVRQRTREIGTRVALGATRGDILWLVLREGASLTLAGLAIGVAAGLVGARALSSILYGVSPSDPLTLAAALAALTAATLGACFAPARRATRIDAARTLAG